MLRRLLPWLIIVTGMIGVAIFGYYALVDWGALQSAYRHFENVAARSTDMPTLFVAESKQNIFRINLFADGVWTLLSAILAAIGIHALLVGSEWSNRKAPPPFP